MNPQAPSNEIQRLIYATRNSLKGYARVFRDEAAFRTQTIVLVALIPLAVWLGRSWTEFALLVGSWALVLAAELGNSAIEAVVDRVGREEHDLAGKAKDAGSAMVMTAMVIAGLVWLAVILDWSG
ncbi:MAG TPA: diacylglycerol kinase [Wenzhouxiangellaceae bacterium]|nr:diacylglycerol kinase [Wenzhouxiangellaceae bacterium]